MQCLIGVIGIVILMGVLAMIVSEMETCDEFQDQEC
jgi:hypothetical protein